MDPVLQKTRTDCGVAVLAYLAGIPYRDAKEAIFGEEPKRSYRTKTADVVRGLEHVGYSVLPVSRTRQWKNLPRGRGYAAVFVREGTRKARHWVAWERSEADGPVRLMDPAQGIFIDADKAMTCFGMSLRSSFAIGAGRGAGNPRDPGRAAAKGGGGT